MSLESVKQKGRLPKLARLFPKLGTTAAGPNI